MQLLNAQRPAIGLGSGIFGPARAPARPIVCAARRDGSEGGELQHAPKLKGAAAAALAASILLTSAAMPGDALAARSGGRVGGSSGFSSSRSAAPRAQPAPQVRNYNTYVSPAPPVFGGYGYGFGGFGGVSLFPTFVTPIGGGIFQFFFVAMIASAVIGAVSRLAGGNRRRDDKWDD